MSTHYTLEHNETEKALENLFNALHLKAKKTQLSLCHSQEKKREKKNKQK